MLPLIPHTNTIFLRTFFFFVVDLRISAYAMRSPSGIGICLFQRRNAADISLFDCHAKKTYTHTPHKPHTTHILHRKRVGNGTGGTGNALNFYAVGHDEYGEGVVGMLLTSTIEKVIADIDIYFP